MITQVHIAAAQQELTEAQAAEAQAAIRHTAAGQPIARVDASPAQIVTFHVMRVWRFIKAKTEAQIVERVRAAASELKRLSEIAAAQACAFVATRVREAKRWQQEQHALYGNPDGQVRTAPTKAASRAHRTGRAFGMIPDWKVCAP